MDQFPIMGAPDTGDTAWVLASAALVLLMTPGLAFFYGGMVRSKSVLNMLMMSFSALGVVDGAVGALRLLARLRQRQRSASSATRRFFGPEGPHRWQRSPGSPLIRHRNRASTR